MYPWWWWYIMDWIGMPADTTSKAENHLTWQKNLFCDCVDLLHNGFVQIAKLIWFQDYLSCPSCILHWILFFLTEIELVKICLLADFQELECQPPSSKEVETLPTAIVLDWFAGSPNLANYNWPRTNSTNDGKSHFHNLHLGTVHTKYFRYKE